MDAMTTAIVTHDPASSRYVLTIDGEQKGELDYIATEATIEIPHTVVDPSLRGSGLGAKLVQESLDDIRDSTELRVIPTCPFVATWLLKHPDYAQLTRR